MKKLFLCLFAALILSPAFALTEVQIVSPTSTEEEGTTVQFKRTKEGAYEFTLTRFLAVDARSWPGVEIADLEIDANADLEVRAGDKLIAHMRVAGERKEKTVVYAFTLARECIAQSKFNLYEDVYPKGEPQQRRLGRTLYELDFAAIDKRVQALVPQRP